MFFSLFSIANTLLGKRELILVLFVRLFGLCCLDLSVSSSWGLGRASVCDCGTPWTFLLPVFNATRHLRHIQAAAIVMAMYL